MFKNNSRNSIKLRDCIQLHTSCNLTVKHIAAGSVLILNVLQQLPIK